MHQQITMRHFRFYSSILALATGLYLHPACSSAHESRAGQYASVYVTVDRYGQLTRVQVLSDPAGYLTNYNQWQLIELLGPKANAKRRQYYPGINNRLSYSFMMRYRPPGVKSGPMRLKDHGRSFSHPGPRRQVQ